MKKVKYFSLACIIFIFTFILSSCGASLPVPENLNVNLENRLTWDKVENARYYNIKAVGEDGTEQTFQTRKSYYTLSKLSEGDYVISVQALGDSQGSTYSEWSVTYDFHRDRESGCSYKLINNNTAYKVTSGRSTSGDVVIEATYRGKPVISIDDSAFKGNTSLTSITIADGITTIGEKAFYNCTALKSVKLPSNLTSIGEASFQKCTSLESINIPNTLTELPSNLFAYCSVLKSIDLPNEITSIGDGAFKSCTSLQTIKLPSELKTIGNDVFSTDSALRSIEINSKLEAISNFAFFKCEVLSEVTIPSNCSIKSIGKNAFYGCNSLTKFDVPSGVTEIGDYAFQLSENLAEVTIPDTVSKVGQFCFNGTKLYMDQMAEKGLIYADTWIVGFEGKENDAEVQTKYRLTSSVSPENHYIVKAGTTGIANSIFYADTNLSACLLPDSVKYLGDYSFYGCIELYQFSAPGLTIINDYTFYGCSKISNLIFETTLKKIGDYAYYGCPLLTEIDIPSSVESIGTYAFKNTGLWTNATKSDSGLVYAGNWVVGCATNKESYTLDSKTVGISNYAFYKNESVNQVINLNSCKYIGYGAFYGCSNLSSIELNRNLKEIQPFTFYKCTSLLTATLPSNIEKIGENAFYKCTSLTALDFSRSKLKEIGDYAFYGCSLLQSVNFGTVEKGVIESIGVSAFYKCESLTSVVLPNSLTSLGQKSFSNCTSLASVTIGSGITAISKYAFNKCAITSLTIPSTILTIDDYAFYKNEVLENLELNEGLTFIGAYAFKGAKALNSLLLPSTLKTISNFSFMDCDSLKSVILRSELDTIIQHAFYSCDSVTFYTDVTEYKDNWQAMFNSSYRPIVFGCELSEDKTYVVSITITSSTFTNVTSTTTIENPERKGYTFKGWKTIIKDEDGNDKEYTYSSSDIPNLLTGVKLEAIWEIKSE